MVVATADLVCRLQNDPVPMQPCLKKECLIPRALHRAHGLGDASSVAVLVAGAVGLVEALPAVGAVVAGATADDTSGALLLRLVRPEKILVAKLYRFLGPSAAAVVELGSACRCWSNSLASCLRIAMRSWIGAWRVVRIRCTREWWAFSPPRTADVSSASASVGEGVSSVLLPAGRRSTRLGYIRVGVKQLVGAGYLPQWACSGNI